MRRAAIVLVGLLVLSSAELMAGDWPQYGYDAGRGAVSPDRLPDELRLLWVRTLPEPRPAWPASQPWLRFDESYSPVAAGKRLFVPSMVTDSLTAYDTETGSPAWQLFADGPVRLAPVVHEGRVYFGSDDGHLYCVDAADGRLAWRFRAGPSDRKVLGNERLISTWPVRGGPVLRDGTIYFTAGIWPFMGIFVHAVDAATGKPVWTNGGYATTWTVQPHNSPAFASLVPRGHLAATERGLVVPGGRTDPGRFDLATGELVGFEFGGKTAGSHHVMARGDWLFVAGTMQGIADGKTVLSTAATLHDAEALYGLEDDELFAQGLQIQQRVVEKTDRKGKPVRVVESGLKPLWRLSLGESPGRLFIKAGPRFYAAQEGQVAAIEADSENEKAEIAWRGAIEGSPWTMLAADEKLFVVTTEGRLYCFGAAQGEPKRYDASLDRSDGESSPSDGGESESLVRAALAEAGVTDGYCVLFGPGVAARARSVAESSRLHVIAIDPNAAQVDAWRRRLEREGFYGTRVAVHEGRAQTFHLPPYLAGLVLCFDAPAGGNVDLDYLKSVFHALRPYGGTALLLMPHDRLASLAREARLPSARAKPFGRFSFLVREGPLPGAADWTHQYADPANSVVSRDQRVKAPLGLLWFGGPPNDQVLPRHGHGPSPQVAAGRLFIEGRNMLRALDAYTGRLLWQNDLTDLGEFYDNTSHQPGANEIGSNYVSLEDSVYVVRGDAILKLNAATGELETQFKAEAGSGDAASNWGFLAAYDDLLVATSSPVQVGESTGLLSAILGAAKSEKDADAEPDAERPAPTIQQVLQPTRYASASRSLVVLNRHSGEKAWEREAQYSFRHNNIAVGAGKLFLIDGLSSAKQDALKRLGVKLDDYVPRLVALDVRTGEEIWSTTEDVFGTLLSYSEEHDVLLEAGSASRDRAKDESDTGMVALRGRDGSVLWKDLARKVAGPCMLHHDTIFTQGPAYWLLTGEPKLAAHPLTGEPIEWKFTRNYGCNTAIASEHLITFRSAAAGYCDLASDGGTGSLGGFKSGCTSNLIVAGGLLNAPEFTRTCECRYQNQTSLALVHDPDAEMWTFNAIAWDGKPVRRVGINFGAPGDRRTPDGTLWLDYPSVGGPSPDLPVRLDVATPVYFRHHGSQVRVPPGTGGLAWVAASGLQGAGLVVVTLANDAPPEPRKYTVRLHFAEPDGLEPGRRVFHVRLQGREALADFDVAAEAGPGVALVKEVPGVEVTDKLEISLVPAAEDRGKPLVCGLEIVAEGW